MSDLAAVTTLMLDSLRATSLGSVLDEMRDVVGGGKMLRANLAVTIGTAVGTPRDTVLRAAAAVEMVHAASLLHDDVIDVGVLRRGAPAFWKRKSVSGAILLGDLMLCKAMQLVEGIDQGRVASLLVSLTGEVCDAEVEQEFVAPGTPEDWEQCVSIARRKTGALFAFAAQAAGGVSGERAEALGEAGYRVGTAFQLADDVMDACGDAERDGKALGNDARKQLLTSMSVKGVSLVQVRQSIGDLCSSSQALLVPWPSLQQAWNEYLRLYLNPVIQRFSGDKG